MVRTRIRNGSSHSGMSHISPRKRPSESPRAYAARLDLMHVQDCLWARMRPSEIARKLGKDPGWVSRAIQKLESERETAFRSPAEEELIQHNLGQLDSILAKAFALAHGETDPKTQLTALKTAADVLRQKTEYEMSIGSVQKGARSEIPEEDSGVITRRMLDEELPEHSMMLILERYMKKKKKREMEAEARQN